MVAGIQSEGTSPMSMPWNSGAATPTTVIGYRFTSTFRRVRPERSRTALSRNRRRAQPPGSCRAFGRLPWSTICRALHSLRGLKITARDELRSRWFVLSACRESDGRRCTAEYALEESLLQLKVAADRIGHQVIAAERINCCWVSLPVDKNKAFWLAYRKRVQNHLIDQRVDSRGCSDPE